MKTLYDLLSYAGHPLFLPFYLLTSTLVLIPNYYGYAVPQRALILVIQTFVTLILLPGLSVFFMQRLGLVSDLTMPKRQERFIPLVVMLTFYLWYYSNLRSLPFALPEYVDYILGIVIGIGLLLLFTLFNKISMHASSWSLLIFYAFLIQRDELSRYLPSADQTNYTTITKIYPWLLLSVGLLVIFARWKTKAHTLTQIGVGVLLGLVSASLSYIIKL